MKYRVIYEVGYCTTWFEFDSIEVAGDFAKTMLIHQVPNKDTGRKMHVDIQVVDKKAKKEEEGEKDG